MNLIDLWTADWWVIPSTIAAGISLLTGLFHAGLYADSSETGHYHSPKTARTAFLAIVDAPLVYLAGPLLLLGVVIYGLTRLYQAGWKE